MCVAVFACALFGLGALLMDLRDLLGHRYPEWPGIALVGARTNHVPDLVADLA